jgi:hypothetical protein
MTFIRRHLRPFIFCILSLLLTYVASVAFGHYQIGIGPEFIVKAFAKLFYLGVAMIFTHVIVKYIFPTIYCDTNSSGGTETSVFRAMWRGDFKDPNVDIRLKLCVYTHIGVFIGVCLLLALAF